MTSLSPRQRDIVAFIQAFRSERGYAPSVREIGEAVGLRSTSSVHAQLHRLKTLGILTSGAPGSARAVAAS